MMNEAKALEASVVSRSEYKRGSESNAEIAFCFAPRGHDSGFDFCHNTLCRPTAELSDAGGPARPSSQPGWPARIRSSDLVRHTKMFLLFDAAKNSGKVTLAIGKSAAT